jgi:hypothetical protein
MNTFATNHPVIFVFGVSFICFPLVLLVSGIINTKLRKPYGDLAQVMIRLAIAVGLLLPLWHLDGLEKPGITRLGGWQVWLFAVAGLLYLTGAGLYAFYNKAAFDITSFTRLPDARTLALTQIFFVLHEEVLFRGVVLYVLYRAWGHTQVGTIGSVVLTAVLFAVPHFMAVFMGTSRSAARLLVVQGCIIAVWWGALVVWGGSIWPAVLLHLVPNVVVPVQGLTDRMVTPDTLAYRRFLWFSIPLGVLGIVLLLQA